VNNFKWTNLQGLTLHPWTNLKLTNLAWNKFTWTNFMNQLNIGSIFNWQTFNWLTFNWLTFNCLTFNWLTFNWLTFNSLTFYWLTFNWLIFDWLNSNWLTSNSLDKFKLIFPLLFSTSLKAFSKEVIHEVFQCTLLVEIGTLDTWLKSTLLLTIKCRDTHIYIKQNVYKQNEMQHYFGSARKSLRGDQREKCLKV